MGAGSDSDVYGILRGVRGELRNWASSLALGYLVSPSRLLPSWNPLIRSRLAKHKLMLQLRNGLEIECQANEFPPFLEIFVERCYEIEDLDWSEVASIVDVGANVGMATLWYAVHAVNASILSLEPSPGAFRELSANVARNEFSKRVTCIPAAMSATPGRAAFGSGFTSVFGRLSETGESQVVVTSLAELLQQHGITALDVLKLDCEGAEYDILLTTDEQVLRQIHFVVGEYHVAQGRSVQALRRALEKADFAVSMTPDRKGVGFFRATRLDRS
ncbi:MAG TPA: FkbM family methyltransferase [Chloroflexota bacterium]|nr:FkbM family methyltransferase [Chloroflexota bacterium]